MSSVQRSESTASPFGFAGVVTASLTQSGTLQFTNPSIQLSGSSQITFTGIQSGVTYAGVGAGGSGATLALGASGGLQNPAGFITLNLSIPASGSALVGGSATTSGGRIIVPYWYQVSGVP